MQRTAPSWLRTPRGFLARVLGFGRVDDHAVDGIKERLFVSAVPHLKPGRRARPVAAPLALAQMVFALAAAGTVEADVAAFMRKRAVKSE